MTSGPECPSCAPARPLCACRSTPSTPNSPTERSTSSSPTTSKTSLPASVTRPLPRRSPSANESCGSLSRMSLSGPTRSPSATPSRSVTAQPARPEAAPTPTRRAKRDLIANCVGGVLSPLLANIALSVLDEHLHEPWRPGGAMSTSMRRQTRRKKALPNWRIVRYANDFVIFVHGTEHDAHALREDVAAVLAPMGLRLSPAKTSVRHFRDGSDCLGFHIQWKRKAGTNKWYVYTFIAHRPVRSRKAKLRALSHRTSLADLGATLIRLNQILRGWSAYFRHAVAMHTFKHLRQFLWWRIVRWLKTRHRWRWTAVRRHLTDHTGRWKPISADGTVLFDLEKVSITRYRYRGAAIPNPWTEPGNGRNRGEPVASRGARRVR